MVQLWLRERADSFLFQFYTLLGSNCVTKLNFFLIDLVNYLF